MNKEQLLETLKGLTTALEAPTTADKPSNEVLIQSFYAGMRFVLDDMQHEKTSMEFTVSGETECGSQDGVTITGDKELAEAFFEEKNLNSWNASHDAKCERYCEQLDEWDVLSTLHDLGLCDKPVRPEAPTTDDDTTNTTDNA